jgi:hypothetical protein
MQEKYYINTNETHKHVILFVERLRATVRDVICRNKTATKNSNTNKLQTIQFYHKLTCCIKGLGEWKLKYDLSKGDTELYTLVILSIVL